MTVPFWCLFAGALLPLVCAGWGAALRKKQLGSLDNEHPRVQALELRGEAARAYAAQQNAWEALAVFTAAVTVNHLAGGDPGLSATASIIWLVARVLHPVMYVRNVVALRSLSFAAAFFSSLWLFGLAISA
jgi:uncharacterized MAPEG superfamily protein